MNWHKSKLAKDRVGGKRDRQTGRQTDRDRDRNRET